MREKDSKCLVTMMVMGLLFAGGMNIFSDTALAQPENILKAAVQDEMKTTNILNSNDVWTSNVLGYCYEGVLQGDPNTFDPIPYILIGFELNGESGLQPEESFPSRDPWWGFLPAEMHDLDFQQHYSDADDYQNQIIAYYDFTDVRFHDGVEADVMDAIFSYHLLAMHPNWYTGIAPLMDGGGLIGNYSTDRWLFVYDVSDEFSDDNNPYTSALRFHLTVNYAQIWIETMSVPLFPQHIWEGTGGGIHTDFGYAIDSRGTGVSIYHPSIDEYNLDVARDWYPANDQVIGTGIFKFKEFISGSHSKIIRNDDYLEKEIGDISIHRPYIEAVEYIKYTSAQQATLALRMGEVDIILWSVPPDFINELRSDPNIAVIANPEPGFFYLAFNMRTPVFGYKKYPPEESTEDVGKDFRRAIAHLIDKKTIVDYYLQGYGTIADGPVSPRLTFWYNSTLPKYDFSIEVAKSILDAAGLVDDPADGDSWRDTDLTTNGDQDDQIEILAPTADYDPIRAQACLLIEDSMIKAGINAKCNHQAFGTITDRIDSRTFEMYILGWAIGGTDPDYLYSFFYSLNGDRGQNYPGYYSSRFDEVILKSRSEMDLTKRQELIRKAQGILAEDLPYNVLYYRKNIEAYRHDRFVGWIVTARGSIYNYWSLMNIKQPSIYYLRTSITVASAVSSNRTETITVTVRDQDKNKVKDAIVNITVEQGNLTYQGIDYGKSWEGQTNVNGEVNILFKAPFIKSTNETVANGTKISITVSATKEGFDEAGIRSVFITVFPIGVKFISVTPKLIYGDVVDELESTEMMVEVKDQDLNRIDGAAINLTATPTDLTIEPNQGVTSNGGKLEGIVLTAPEVDKETVYIIFATPLKEGYKGIPGSVEVIVLDSLPIPPPPPDYTLLIIIAIIFIAAVSLGGFLKMRKSRR